MHNSSWVRRTALAITAAGSIAAGCLPYTVGSTARPAPHGTIQQTGSLYGIPGGVESDDDSISVPLWGADAELRYGLDDYSDIGLRIPAASGAVVTYKRRLNGPSQADGAALAVMAGAGFVNFGEHAIGELTILASAHDRGRWTPYGGLRAMHVLPLSRYAVSDRPTAGGFFGVRLGTADFGISPEVGIYYDPSALGLRERRVLVVPAISVHGGKLLSLLSTIMRGMR